MKKYILYSFLPVLLLFLIVACGSDKQTDTTNPTVTGQTDNQSPTDITIKKGDLSESVSEEDAITIDVTDSEESGITLTEGGTYRLTGVATDFMITVDSEDKIILILDQLNLTNASPAIYVKNAKKCILHLPEGTTSTLTDTIYDISGEDTPNAVIYSKDDLTVNGSGTLILHATNHHGIYGKDDVVIVDAKLNIDSANVALKGKDSVVLSNATLSLTAGTTGIKTSNSDDQDKGSVWIADSTVTIDCNKDGIHAESNLILKSGSINIVHCNEGLEGGSIYIYDGILSIVASDDGINATKDSLEINGGTITIDAKGDGVDSNNTFTMNGGTLYISGPSDNGNSAIDYERSATFHGGTILALGSSGMAENFTSSTSSQCVALIGFDTRATGTFTVKEESGNILLTFDSTKQYNCALITSPALVTGATYTLEADNTLLLSFTPDSSLYTLGISGFGPGGGPGGRPDKDNRPSDGNPPNGNTYPDDGGRPDAGGRPNDDNRPDNKNWRDDL